MLAGKGKIPEAQARQVNIVKKQPKSKKTIEFFRKIKRNNPMSSKVCLKKLKKTNLWHLLLLREKTQDVQCLRPQAFYVLNHRTHHA